VFAYSKVMAPLSCSGQHVPAARGKRKKKKKKKEKKSSPGHQAPRSPSRLIVVVARQKETRCAPVLAAPRGPPALCRPIRPRGEREEEKGKKDLRVGWYLVEIPDLSLLSMRADSTSTPMKAEEGGRETEAGGEHQPPG